MCVASSPASPAVTPMRSARSAFAPAYNPEGCFIIHPVQTTLRGARRFLAVLWWRFAMRFARRLHPRVHLAASTSARSAATPSANPPGFRWCVATVIIYRCVATGAQLQPAPRTRLRRAAPAVGLRRRAFVSARLVDAFAPSCAEQACGSGACVECWGSYLISKLNEVVRPSAVLPRCFFDWPGPGADVAGASPVPAQIWQGCAQSRRRCGESPRI